LDIAALIIPETNRFIWKKHFLSAQENLIDNYEAKSEPAFVYLSCYYESYRTAYGP